MHKPLYWIVAAVALGALGWWGWTTQRSLDASRIEISAGTGQAPSGAPGQAAPGAAGAGAAKGASGGPPVGGARGPGGPGGPVGVEAARAVAVDLADDVLAVGTLRANESVVVKPEIAGRVSRVEFADGARVQKGALLVELDRSVLAAQVEQIRAELSLARANYERTVDLAARNFVSGSARDQAAANLGVQEARLKLAEAQLSKTEIRAPFAGVLGLRNVSVGDFVKDGTELVVLEDLSSMKVDLRLPERFLGQLRRGQPIRLSVDAFPGRDFVATLDALDVQVDANGRSVLARGRLPNADSTLRSGMFAKARIVLQQRAGAIVVPEEALVPSGSDVLVFRVVDGKAMRTKVRTGIRQAGRVEIVDGLAAGDLVVTAGQIKLARDGLDVRVIDPNAARQGGGGAPAGAGAPGAAAAGASAPSAAPAGAPAAAAGSAPAQAAAPAPSPAR